MKLGIILETKELEKAWRAFRFVTSGRELGHEVKVFLMGEAVACESLHDEKCDVADQLSKFVRECGELLACGTWLKIRQLGANDVCPVSSMIDCVRLVEWADKTVTF